MNNNYSHRSLGFDYQHVENEFKEKNRNKTGQGN